MEWTVRMEGAKILKEIGGKKSIEPLKFLSTSDENGVVKLTAASALKEIEKRAAENK